MRHRALRDRQFGRGGQLGSVALAVGHAERMAGETLLARQRQRHRRVHAAGNQYHRLFLLTAHLDAERGFTADLHGSKRIKADRAKSWDGDETSSNLPIRFYLPLSA